MAPDFSDFLQVETVVTKQLEGAIRYNEISKKLGRPAPVPSIFINGELIYEQTPSQEILREYLEDLIKEFR